MKISVIGAGYVGLTTAACLAQIGHEVLCGESDSEKLKKLHAGVLPLFEPYLEQMVKLTGQEGRLKFGSSDQALDWGEAVFICVGTPPLSNGEADLSAIEAVARSIAKRASGYRLIVEKSTVPVQTAVQLRKHLSVHRRNGLHYDVVSNPEFLREGSAVEDLLHPDRIVIGVDSLRAESYMREIYKPILSGAFTCPVHKTCAENKRTRFLVTDTNSSELIKHASNSFLAMKISFINMVSDLCEMVGADVAKVAEGMGLDPRIGPAFLNPGLGFGGFCFPKDLQAFIRIAEKAGCDFSLLKEVEKVNQGRIDHFLEKIRQELWVLKGKNIAIWGLAFKPNTDDVRFAPSIVLVQKLLKEGATVMAFDPQAMERSKEILPHIKYCSTPYEAARGADAILIVTDWDEFRRIDWEILKSEVERPLILDGRNMFDGEEVTRYGFQYISIGRRSAAPSLDEIVPVTDSAPLSEADVTTTGLFRNRIIESSRY